MSRDETQEFGLWPAALGALALGFAVQQANGAYDPKALVAVTVAFAASLIATFAPRIAWIPSRWMLWGFGVCFAYQFVQLFTKPPGIYLRVPADAYLTYTTLLVLSALLVAGGLGRDEWLGRFRFPLLLLAHLALGAWLIRSSPSPWIDVHIFQKDSVAALVHGQNPYALTFPDIYGAMSSVFYGPGLSVGGRLQFGYPYPPLTLLMAMPGQLIGGDYRYGQLVAMVASGALIYYARPSPSSGAAAALLLFTPRGLFVLEQGWTEPYLVLLLALVAFLLARGLTKPLPYLAGLFVASKQYLVFTLPALALVLRWPLPKKELLTQLGKAAGAGALVVLPFFLWSPSAFIHSVVTLQTIQPFRRDALSYPAWLFGDTGQLPFQWLQALPLLVGLLIGAAVLWKAPRNVGAFCAAFAAISIGFFAFAKQAFCNYYYLPLAALAFSAALGTRASQRPAVAEPSPEADAAPASAGATAIGR